MKGSAREEGARSGDGAGRGSGTGQGRATLRGPRQTKWAGSHMSRRLRCKCSLLPPSVSDIFSVDSTNSETLLFEAS